MLSILTSLFDWVGLRTNMRRKVIMACQPYHVSVRMLVEAYERRSAGTVITFWDIQRKRLECPYCGAEVESGLMLTHHQSQHDVERGDRRGFTPPWRPKLTGSLSRNVCCGSSARYTGAWVGLQSGPTSGFTLRTATCRTKS